MKFEINEYPGAAITDPGDREYPDLWTLGEPGAVIQTIECDYPAQMRAHIPQRAEYLTVEEEGIPHAWREPLGRVLAVRMVD